MNLDYLDLNKKEILLILICTLFFSFLSECYIVILENSSKIFTGGNLNAINLVFINNNIFYCFYNSFQKRFKI